MSIEIEEYRVPEATLYPTSLDRTGLAMITLAVDDVAVVRSRCGTAGIVPVADHAIPAGSEAAPDGLILRGAAGELVEVVERQ